MKAKMKLRPSYLLYNLKRLDKKHVAIVCLDCGWMRASFYRHDYVTCPCPNQAMIDGGFTYYRYGAMKMDRVQLLGLAPEEFKIIRKSKRELDK